MDPIRADDELIERLARGYQPGSDDRLEQLLAAWRDECRATPPRRAWQPLIPDAHLAHVRYALLILTLLVTGLSIVIPSRIGTVLCWIGAIVAWIGFIIAVVIPGFDRDEQRHDLT